MAQTRTNLLEELPSGLDEGLCIFCCNSIMICSLHTDNLRVLLKCLGRSVWLNGAKVFAPLKRAIKVCSQLIVNIWSILSPKISTIKSYRSSKTFEEYRKIVSMQRRNHDGITTKNAQHSEMPLGFHIRMGKQNWGGHNLSTLPTC